jgi:hypothetical protein
MRNRNKPAVEITIKVASEVLKDLAKVRTLSPLGVKQASKISPVQKVFPPSIVV